MLLYAGETPETLAGTQAWLEARVDRIKGVSVGARLVCPDDVESKGYAELHMSDSLPHEACTAASRALSRRLMSARDYFDLKSFSYFPPSFTFDAFLCLARAVPPEALPSELPA